MTARALELPAGWSLERERVTWSRWDERLLRTLVSHPWQWVLIGPDDRGTTYHDTRADALERLRSDVAAAADALETWADPHDCDDIPCPTYGDDCPWQRAGALRLELEAVPA